MRPVGKTILKLVGPIALWRAFPTILNSCRIPEEDQVFFERIREVMTQPISNQEIGATFHFDEKAIGLPSSSSHLYETAKGIIKAIKKCSGSHLANPLNMILVRDLIRYKDLIETLAQSMSDRRLKAIPRNLDPKDWLRTQIEYYEGQVDPLEKTLPAKAERRSMRRLRTIIPSGGYGL